MRTGRYLPITAALVAAAVFASPAIARAQFDVARSAKRGPAFPSRTFVGITGIVAQPVGEFQNYVGTAGGFGLNFVQQLDRNGAFGLRLDLDYVIYGHEKQRIHPFPRIDADLTTDNNIVFAGIGPQIMVPNGHFRPYLSGSVGLAYFFTHSSIEGKDDTNNDLFNTTNQHDATFAYTGAAGLYIPVRHGNRPISIDLGARYHNNGTAEYLREGSIIDNPDNTVSFTPFRTKTNLVTYHLGVSFGI